MTLKLDGQQGNPDSLLPKQHSAYVQQVSSGSFESRMALLRNRATSPKSETQTLGSTHNAFDTTFTHSEMTECHKVEVWRLCQNLTTHFAAG
jgi:hypothetical protein